MSVLFSRKLVFLVMFFLAFGLVAPKPASAAMDRRLKVLMKTSALGSIGGTLLGAAAWGLGLVPVKGMFMGSSIGFYSGILLGAYLIATPDKKQRFPDPTLPRQSVPKRYDDEDELEQDEMDEIAPPPPAAPRPGADAQGAARQLDGIMLSALKFKKVDYKVWVPVVSLQF